MFTYWGIIQKGHMLTQIYLSDIDETVHTHHHFFLAMSQEQSNLQKENKLWVLWKQQWAVGGHQNILEAVFSKSFSRTSFSLVIVSNQSAPSFTFQCSFLVRMTVVWARSYVTVRRMDLISPVSLQYHLSGLTALNDYTYHLVIVFLSIPRWELIFKSGHAIRL